MFNNDNTTILFILCIIFLVGFIYISTTENMTLMQSTIDGELYKVRDLPDKQLAANMLATIKLNIQVIVNYLYTNKTKYPKYTKYINYLLDNYKYITIRENSTNSSTTSYSINKQNLVFCLRSKELHDNSIHQMNLIMYVVLHELAHVACPVYDNHGTQFKTVFTFLISIAKQLNLYSDLELNGTIEYCGIKI